MPLYAVNVADLNGNRYWMKRFSSDGPGKAYFMALVVGA